MPPASTRTVLAGVAGAGVWAAVEPLVARRLRSGYSDVRLLGAMVTPGRGWPLAGAALHLANGAVFGAAYGRLRKRSLLRALAAAQVENAVLWPGMALMDRVHPDRRSGRWPPLVGNRRVVSQEVLMHLVFGAVLGVLDGASACRYSARHRLKGIAERWQ